MTLTEGQILALKVSDLKAKLAEHGLPTIGVKAVLQKRMIEFCKSQPAAATGMDTEETTTTTETVENSEGTIDETVRYKGTVLKYEYRRGFGLITPEDGGKPMYVHWKQIQSSDSWPSLTKGMSVEYYVGERKRGGKGKRAGEMQKFAANVTLEGGQEVSVSEDDLKKTYPDRTQRFAGIVKFFHGRKGYGFVKPKEDITFADKTFKAGNPNIYIAREDIKTDADRAPALKDDQEVEFTLYKREKADNWGAGDVTLPGGATFTAEHFKDLGPRINFKKKFGNQKGFGPMKGMKNMKGMSFMPMMGGGMMPQMVMMNGQMMMVMPMANQTKGWKSKGKGKGKKKPTTASW